MLFSAGPGRAAGHASPPGFPVTGHRPAGAPPPPVIPAGPADLDALSQVIADAFHDLAPSQWLLADPEERREIFPGYFTLYLEHALASGVVHTTPDRAAAALWIPAGPGADSPPADYTARLAAITGRRASRFRAFDATLDRYHPTGIPHHHLAILAVRPGRQGQGIGTALLNAYRQVLDRDATLAYLEASSLRSRSLYLRHGYVPRPGGPFCLPDGGPPMWPMMREPSPRPPGHDTPSPTAAPSTAAAIPQQDPTRETAP